MPRHPGAHRAEKRRKEIKRQQKQEAKRLRRDEKSQVRNREEQENGANPEPVLERDSGDSALEHDAQPAEKGEHDA